MNIICWYKTKKNGRDFQQIVSLLFVLPSFLRAQDTLGCPDLIRSNKCSCNTFEDGLFLDCQDAIIKNVKSALRSMSNIHSLSIYDLDDNQEGLGPNFVPQGLCIKHIHIERANIRDISDDTFMPLRKCLETLSIVSSKIKYVPQKSFSGMLKLISIDLTSNYIEEIPSYSFYGLPLMKLNVKGNLIHDISDFAFSSLELSLSEIDLSENNLTAFPIVALAKLRHLRSLRLAWNEMYFFPSVDNSDLKTLEYLDLNSNNFEFISEDCLKFCPSLTTLSFHFNLIHNIHYRAFYSLVNLKSIDLSHNRIKLLNPNIFQNNKHLKYIKLNNNHLHHIHRLFSNMPALVEVFLSHNNILEVPIDSFYNSSEIGAIHLDENCISNINKDSFYNLENLAKLRLEFNYISKVPHSILNRTKQLIDLRLDNNNICEFHNNTFWSQLIIREIRLNNNKLKFISKYLFTNSTKLVEIHLNNNELSFIEPGAFMRMPNLKYVNLQNNNLYDINDVLPKLNSNMLTLHLDSNALTLLSAFMFQNLENLRHLSLKNNHLKFLTKTTFRNLTHLIRLELNSNEFSIIDDFAFQNLQSARFLDLQNNILRNLTRYTFFGLSELEDLDISHNRISVIYDMAFDTLKKLRSLNLSFNPIKQLNKNIFQQSLPLSSLYLDNCVINVIENGTFHGLNNLKYLSLKNNSLKSEDLLSIDVGSLKHLSLSYNDLDFLPVEAFSRLPLLEVLLLERCNIESIFEGTFTHNQNLLKLNLARNIITALPTQMFDEFNSMTDFNISNNFLDYVPYNTLQNFSHVQSLDLTDNLLPKVEISGFAKLIKLKYLVLRKNEISTISARKKIQYNDIILFDISYNRIVNIPAFILDVFPNIQIINASYNDIVYFDFLNSYKRHGITLVNIDLSKNPVNSWTLPRRDGATLMSSLFELHVCGTNMSVVDDVMFESFTNLQNLYLKFNKIRRLSISPFSKLVNLENLDLSHNKLAQLKTINFRGLTKLRTLCLTNNNIESLESFAEELSNLKLLDLSHNKIQNILNEDLINLKELTVLYLAHNNIKYISITAFRNLNKIVQIDLNQNKLQNIPIDLLDSVENHIQDISIKGNTLECSCQKNNTWVWIQDHPKIIKSDTVTCVNNEYPKERCNVPILSQLSVDRHRDNSVSVSWFIRNRTAIKALQILYYNEDVNSNVKTKYLDKSEISTRIANLESNRNYVVCVLTVYEDPILEAVEFTIGNGTESSWNVTANTTEDVVESILIRSPSSECLSFDTFKRSSGKLRPNKVFDISLLLNRRMGLIVGCSLGFVVFFVMVSVLLYTKIKERKRIAKSDPAWAEMNDYHSVYSKDDVLDNPTATSTDNILLGMSRGRTISLDR